MTKKVLVITDAQQEFITGALGNKECEAAVKNIVAAAEIGEYYKVIVTRDTHTADYLNTQEGRRLPVDFGNVLKAIWAEVTAAGEAAEGEYPMEVDFTGFCTGICVLSNVVMAKAFVPEARVCVIEKACACVTPQTHQTAIAAMGPIQVDVI